MSSRSIWETLGVAQTSDRAVIRRAYAARLKVVHPEDDPEGFQDLRAAYERALAMASQPAVVDIAPAWDEPDNELQTDEFGRPVDEPSVERIVYRQLSRRRRVEPAPPSPERLLDQARQRLEKLVMQVGTPAPDVLAAVLEPVLASPALEQLGIYVRTEEWLSALIARHLPRTDPLVAPSMARFDWVVDERDRHVDQHIAAVVARNADLQRLEKLRDKSHPMRRVVRMLEQPPTRRDSWVSAMVPGRLGNLRRLITEIETKHPGLEISFPEGVFDAWRTFLDHPRLSAAAVWLTMGFAPFLAWVVDAGRAPKPVDGSAHITAAFFIWWPAFAAAGLGVLAIKLYLFDLPRYLWRTRYAERSGPWLRLGWVRTGFSLILMSLILPAEPRSTGGVAVFGVALVLWAYATGERFIPSANIYAWPVRWVGRNTPLVAMWWILLAQAHDPMGPQVAVAVAACALATCLGEATLGRLWIERVTAGTRFRLLLGACAVSAGLVVAAFAAGDKAVPIYLAAAISGMALVQRAPAAVAPSIRTRLALASHPRAVFIGGMIGLACIRAVSAEAMPISAWVVTIGTLTGFATALNREWEARKPKPAKVFS